MTGRTRALGKKSRRGCYSPNLKIRRDGSKKDRVLRLHLSFGFRTDRNGPTDFQLRLKYSSIDNTEPDQSFGMKKFHPWLNKNLAATQLKIAVADLSSDWIKMPLPFGG